MTKKEIKKKYTRLNNGRLYLCIDNQEFEIIITPTKDKWFRDQLVRALSRLINKKDYNFMSDLYIPALKKNYHWYSIGNGNKNHIIVLKEGHIGQTLCGIAGETHPPYGDWPPSECKTCIQISKRAEETTI